MRLSNSCRLSFPDMADQIHSVTKLQSLAVAGASSECYGAYNALHTRSSGMSSAAAFQTSRHAAAHERNLASACLMPASRVLLVSRHGSSRDLTTWMPEAAGSVTNLSTRRQQ